MPDIVDAQTRSRMMSGIRGKNTKPEMLVRKGLHARGFRYRLHSAGVPGKPDIILRRYRAAVFVHGCFWHGHDCHLFRMPSTRQDFWKAKIGRNRARDLAVRDALRQKGWRQGIVWECALKGKTRRPTDEVLDNLAEWLRGEAPTIEIAGRG